MHTVEVLLRPGDIDLQMNRFRLWLKSHSVQPVSFGYSERATAVVVRVEFDAQEDAAAFSDRFEGVCQTQTALATVDDCGAA
ncbi:MAG TPA: hypothetical protein VN668_09250 [Stellaceae bacterium]|nr:hypothetical protein [Stellaceae bacterium]